MNPSMSDAFPTFDDDQLTVVAEVGELAQFEPNQFLIRQGQKGFPFYVLKSGTV